MTERELRRIVRALTDELRTLRQEIRRIQDERQTSEAQRAEKPLRPIPVEIQPDAITHHSVRDYYESENQERKSWWGRNRRWVETSGVAVAFVVAIFSIATTYEIRKQTPAIIKSANATLDKGRDIGAFFMDGRLTVMSLRIHHSIFLCSVPNWLK